MRTLSLPKSATGEEVGLHLAAELEAGHEASFADRLADCGLTESQVEAVEGLIEAEAERLGYHRAGEVLREVFRRVSSVNAAGAALAFALGMSENRSLAALGAQFGQTKQSVGNIVRRLAPLLNGLAVSRAGARPDLPGHWLTVTEAAKLTGRTAITIQSAGAAGELRRVIVGRQGFFDEADLRTWSHSLTLRATVCSQQQVRRFPNSNPAPVKCSA